jgi:hypothetical protein
MCPHCGQNAPVVYRGVLAYCTACGALRPPLTGSALQLAGQPSRIGGLVARVLGWIVLSVGLALALAVGIGAHLLFPDGVVGLLASAPIAVLSLVVGGFLLFGGGRLNRSGVSAERDARTQAIYALATHRRGELGAADVARALDVRIEEASALLDSLARAEPERVTVDVDTTGALVYRFDVPTRTRVDPEVAHSPNREEWERLEAEEASKAAQRARAPR